VISLEGVSSALIARNESWVRQEASRLSRRLPSNIEKADLIQVGLIAVAQASIGFVWDGMTADSDGGRDAFVRYARKRVKGAMLDELRQMDHLGRAERRKVKVVQIARERFSAIHGRDATLSELSQVSSLPLAEIARLDQVALQAQTDSLDVDPASETVHHLHQPATAADDVEARVDTAIVLKRLEKFFATLPERERQLIDTYLGIGLTPVALAKEWHVSPSRISQLFRISCERIAKHFAAGKPVLTGRRHPVDWEQQIAKRELALSGTEPVSGWGALIEQALQSAPRGLPPSDADGPRMNVAADTRWG
jgi:RNA polymerase sigma factor for flagellar operon FliA